MNRIVYHLNLLCFTALVLGGCSKTPQVDRFFGTSYDYARESQLADPSAGVSRVPLTGMEGSVSAKAIDRYKATFDQPAPKTESYTIDVSGISKK